MLLRSKSSLLMSGMFKGLKPGPAADPGIRSNDDSRLSKTESCVTLCHDSGRNWDGWDGGDDLRGEEEA